MTLSKEDPMKRHFVQSIFNVAAIFAILVLAIVVLGKIITKTLLFQTLDVLTESC